MKYFVHAVATVSLGLGGCSTSGGSDVASPDMQGRVEFSREQAKDQGLRPSVLSQSESTLETRSGSEKIVASKPIAKATSLGRIRSTIVSPQPSAAKFIAKVGALRHSSLLLFDTEKGQGTLEIPADKVVLPFEVTAVSQDQLRYHVRGSFGVGWVNRFDVQTDRELIPRSVVDRQPDGKENKIGVRSIAK
ncbi:MAG: hypothetical protein ABL901_00865 [Hyphomicrobiaceae bacterium]|nr:hypothetical protein [Hyphomicrobiaceae bacterium]